MQTINQLTRFLLFGAAFITTPVWSAPELTVSHRLVDSNAAGEETVVTLAVNVTNSGSEDLATVALAPTAPVTLTNPHDTLNLGALTAGQGYSGTWVFSVASGAQLEAMLSGDVYLSASVTAPDGVHSTVAVTSTGGGE